LIKNIEIKNKIMKKLLFILSLFFSLNCFSQDEIVKIPQQELEDFFLSIDTLKQQDSIKTILISDLELQVLNFKTLSYHDSILLRYRTQEIELLNDQIKLFNDRLNQVDKWYEKPWVGVIGGVVGTLATIHIIDYSLPK
tara:strand:- start:135 stop:551 length:417 start_codon:yes stop_codon:yes gene_type:complete